MARAPKRELRKPVPRRSELETVAMAICARVYGQECACDKRQDPRPCHCMKSAAISAAAMLAPEKATALAEEDRSVEQDRT